MPKNIKKKKAENVKVTKQKKRIKADPTIPVPKTANELCRTLLYQRKFTDEEVFNKVVKRFPESNFRRPYITTTRNDLNKGYYKGMIVNGNPIVRIIKNKKK